MLLAQLEQMNPDDPALQQRILADGGYVGQPFAQAVEELLGAEEEFLRLGVSAIADGAPLQQFIPTDEELATEQARAARLRLAMIWAFSAEPRAHIAALLEVEA